MTRMLRINPLLLALLLALLPAAPVAAEVYKWVDDEGVTHYSQQPPPGNDAQVIDPRVSRPSGSSAPGGDGDDTAADSGGDDDAEGGDTQTVADFCNELRERAQLLSSDRPVKLRGDDDTLTDLEGDARQQELDRVRGQIEQNCQGDDS